NGRSRSRGRGVVGDRNRPSCRARRAAFARWDGRRHRVPDPSLLSRRQAARAGVGQRHRTVGAARSAALMPAQYDDVAVGDELPPLEVPLTRTLIVATAIASRDYQDVHHDPELAQQRGSKDIFMNILSTNGFVGRFVTDWAGPDAVLKKVAIRLGAPNYPGDTMRLTGHVSAKDEGEVELTLRGANSLGDHVSGTVRLALPR